MAQGNLPVPPDDWPSPGYPTGTSGPPDLSDPHAPAGVAKPPPEKRRRRRRWPYVIGALLLLLVLLVLLAPTIAGTAPVRSIIVGQVNQRLNGKVQIGDLSLGWISSIKVGGLKVFDSAGAQILELPKLTTELSLLDLVRGKLHFGKVTVDGLNATVKRDAQGNLNFAQLMKQENAKPQAASSGKAPAPSDTTSKTKLPDVSGELHLVNCRATFEDQLQGQTFFFPSIAGTLKCPDVNGPIEDALDIACKVGDGQTGKLTLAGRADVADNNIIDPDKADVDQKVTIQDVDLGSFAFALGKDAPLQKLAGLTSGAVTLRYKGGEGAGLEAEITSTNFAAGGPALKRDTFATQKLSLVIPPTTVTMPPGATDWKSYAVRIGSSGGPSEIVLAMDQGTVRVGVDAPLKALDNLGSNQPPGAAGEIRADADLDVGALARQMPHVLAVQEGLTLSSGRFTQSMGVQLAPDHVAVQRFQTRLVDVRGQRGQQAVALQPIDLSLTASSFGGGWAAPNVRDLNLTLSSGFANASFTGQDLAALSGNAKGDLKRLREELGQVFDMGDLQLAGPFDVQVASKGDVATGGNAALSTTVTITDLLVGTEKDKAPLRQSRVQLVAGGEIVRRKDGSVEQLRSGNITLSTGDAAQPTVAAQITIPSVAMAPPPTTAPANAAASTQPASGVASATYQVAQLAVNLPKARAELGDLIPALKEYAFDRGVLNVTGGGNYDHGNLTYDGRVAVNDLTFARTPAPDPAVPAAPVGRIQVLQGYTLNTDAAFTRSSQPDGASLIDVTKLKVSDNTNMLSLGKAADTPLRVATSVGPNARAEASGKLDLSLDVKQLNDLVARLGAKTPAELAPQPGATELRGGRVGGTLQLARANPAEMRVTANLEGIGLTVGGPRGNALNNEHALLFAQMRAKDDFSTAAVDKLDLTGDILTANVSGTTLLLKVGQGPAARSATTAEMLQTASIKAQVPNLGKLQALLDALSKPEVPTQTAAAPAPSPLYPGERVGVRGRSSEISNLKSEISDLRSQISDPKSEISDLRSQISNLKFESPDQAPVVHPVLLAQARQAPPPDQIIGRRPQPAPQRNAAPAPAPARPAPPPAAPPPATETKPPAPPTKLTGGSATISLDVKRDGSRTVITPDVTAKNVTLAKGEASTTLDAVDLKTSLSYVPVAPPATMPAIAPARAAAAATKEGPAFSDQIRDLQIPTLVAHAAGSTITLVEPVMISDVGALGRLFSPATDANGRAAPPPDLKTALRAEGDVGQLSALMVALGMIGDPAGPKQPYTGKYNLEQRLAAGKDGVAATGQLNLADFVVTGGAFNEKSIRFANDVTLDSARDALALRNVALSMESTKALELKLAGNILDYSTKRRFDNVAGTIGYDWAKVWEIVRPMMSKETQDSLKLKLAGQAQRQFALGGSYPAVDAKGQPVPFNQAIRTLTGYFDGGFQLLEVNGLQVQNLDVPLTLQDGKLTVAYHDKPQGQNLPPPADCNSGKLNIGGAVVDLAEESPRLTMAKGTKLLSNATLNPVFSDMFGGMINNPLFVSPSEARGLVDVTVVDCNRLPLSALVLKNAPNNDGRAEFLFSIREVYLGNSMLLKALSLAGQSDFAQSLQGEIRESRVIIERGTTRQDVVFNAGESDRPFRIAGSTSLDTKALDLTFTIPPQLLKQLGSVGKQAAQILPDGLPIPLGGTTRAPQLDLNRALTSAVKEGLLPGLLRRATGDKGAAMPKDNNPRPGTNEPPPGADPLKDLFDLVGGKKQKDKDKQDQPNRQR